MSNHYRSYKYRDAFRPVASSSHANKYNDQYNMTNDAAVYAPSNIFRGGRSRATRGRTRGRAQAHRYAQSGITEKDLSEELRKKLFPGNELPQEILDEVEALQTFKAIELCVTSRAIGFGTAQIFMSFGQFNDVPDTGTIYQLYRLNLAIFQVKVMLTQRSVRSIQNYEESYTFQHVLNLICTIESVGSIPDQVSSIINAIGQVESGGRLFIPRVGRSNVTELAFIPQAEQITYDNLRQTVMALADEKVPVIYRLKFYLNNPIPGCIWRGLPDNPVLCNPDEIIPANHTIEDLQKDIDQVRGKLNFLNRKMPRYFSKPISYEPIGSRAMLVCNEQEDMTVIDRNAGEALEDYYARLKIRGNVTHYYNIDEIRGSEQLEGCLCLLGEHPTSENLEYPVYVTRNERVCPQLCRLSYQSAFNMKYIYRG